MFGRESFTVDDEAVTRWKGKRVLEQARWDRLALVVVVTTDEGPFVEDVFMLLGQDDGKGVAVPQAQWTELGLLERVQDLPGFDNEALIEAMASTDNARFELWRRDARGDSPEDGGPSDAPAAPSDLRTVVAQRWVEHESGWGQRDDGFSVHLDEAQRAAYVQARLQSPEGEEFDRPTGDPYVVLAGPELAEALRKSAYGLRSFDRSRTPEVGVEVQDGPHLEDGAAYLRRLAELYGKRP